MRFPRSRLARARSRLARTCSRASHCAAHAAHRVSRTSRGLRIPGIVAAALAAFLLLPAATAAQGSGGTGTPGANASNAGLPLEGSESPRFLSFTATEGSWISLDVSPDGRTIVFDLLGDLYLMPIEGGDATRLTRGMGHNAMPRFSPDGQRVVFISDRDGGDNVWVISTDLSDTIQVTRGKTDQYVSPVFTPDGAYVIASKGGRAQKPWIYHLRGGTGAALFTEPEQLRVTGLSFGPDPRYLWFAERTGLWQYNAVFPQYQLAYWDRERGTRTVVTSRYGSAFRPVLSPDGRHLVYGTRHASETGLRIRDLESGAERWLAFPIQRDDQESTAELDVLPGYAFLPSGDAIVLSYGGKIWQLPIAEGAAPREIPFRVQVEREIGPEVRFEYPVEVDPAFVVRQIRDAVPSPDGRRLAFTALNALYVMDLPEGAPRRLATPGVVGHHHQPIWSPEGRDLVFVSWDDETGGHLWRVAADGRGTPRRLTSVAAFYREPAWSPDGARIVAIRAAARDVQESRGFFGGGLAQQFVWVPATGGEVEVIGPAQGRSGLHFAGSADRIYASSGPAGLVSFRWDGTDERSHVIVTGPTPPGGTTPPRANRILLSPDGTHALAILELDLYVVTVPQIGSQAPTISVANPDNAAFPVERLTDEIGGQFARWSPDGKRVHWTIGRTHMVYDLAESRAMREAARIAAREAPADADAPEVETSEPAEPAETAETPETSETGAQADTANATPVYRPQEIEISAEATRDIPEGVLVLRNARAITMRGYEIIERADIVIRNNRIEAIGAAGTLDLPAGATEIDVEGRTVMPGYVDTHYHTQWLITDIHSSQVWQYLTNLAFGVTLAHDVQTATTDILTYQDLVEAGRMIGPRISHTGPGVFSRANVRNLDHARDILRRYRNHYRVNTFKMYMTGNREQRQWLIKAARELELMPTVEAGLQYRLNITQVMDGYAGLEHSLPIYPLFGDVLELFRTTQVTYNPTLLVSYGGPWAEDYFFATEDVFGDPRIRHFTPFEELDAKASRRGSGGQAGWFHRDEHVFDRHAEFVRDLVEAGGRAGVGAHGQFHGLGYHWELWAMQSGGLSEHDALRVATILGAESIGFGNDLGSLEPGKLADLVILDADPLSDIRNTAAVRHVMKNGRLYEGATLNEVWPTVRSLPSFHWQRHEPAVNTGIPARLR